MFFEFSITARKEISLYTRCSKLRSLKVKRNLIRLLVISRNKANMKCRPLLVSIRFPDRPTRSPAGVVSDPAIQNQNQHCTKVQPSVHIVTCPSPFPTDFSIFFVNTAAYGAFHVRKVKPNYLCWNFRTVYGARNRVEIGLSYRTARLYRLAESILWNRFLVSLKVLSYRLWMVFLCHEPTITNNWLNQQIEAGGLNDCQGGKVTVSVWEWSVSLKVGLHKPATQLEMQRRLVLHLFHPLCCVYWSQSIEEGIAVSTKSPH